jgi:hypothetical protein
MQNENRPTEGQNSEKLEDESALHCGNCIHYQPYHDSQTGRIHPTKQGRCGWKLNIKWPMAYRRTGYGWREEDPMMYPVGVWKHTDAKTCACFSPNVERTHGVNHNQP